MYDIYSSFSSIGIYVVREEEIMINKIYSHTLKYLCHIMGSIFIWRMRTLLHLELVLCTYLILFIMKVYLMIFLFDHISNDVLNYVELENSIWRLELLNHCLQVHLQNYHGKVVSSTYFPKS